MVKHEENDVMSLSRTSRLAKDRGYFSLEWKMLPCAAEEHGLIGLWWNDWPQADCLGAPLGDSGLGLRART